MNKKIVKFVGTGILAIALTSGGISIYDSSIDHTEEICPLTNYFGVGHQIDVINNDSDSLSNGIRAYYMETELELLGFVLNEDGSATKTIEIDPIIIEENGEKISCAPEGFTLEGNKCYRTITVDDSYAEYGFVIIKRNEVTENILSFKKDK